MRKKRSLDRQPTLKQRKHRHVSRLRRMLCEQLETRRVLAGAGPEVVDITQLDAELTGAGNVRFEVQFDESVTGVDSTDFQIASTGLTGPSISGVTGSGLTYTVTANTGSGDGTLRLDLIDDDSIVNGQNKPLAGAGTSGTKDGSFTGPTYNIDKTTPQMSVALLDPAPTSAASVRYDITFSETVVGLSTTNLMPRYMDFPGDDLEGVTITSLTGSGTDYVATLATGTGSGGLSLVVVNDGNFADLAGNTPAMTYASGSVYSIDRRSPILESVVLEDTTPTNASPLNFLVNFSEHVNGISSSVFEIDHTGFPSAFVNSVVTLGGGQFRVSVNPGVGEGTLSIDVVPSATTKDYAGNPLIVSDNDHPAYTVDTRLPSTERISIAGNSVTSASEVDFEVVFDEAMQNVSDDDFVLATVGVSDAAIMSVSEDAGVFTVKVSTGSGEGTLGLNVVTTGTATDLIGNGLSSNATGPLVSIDRTAPSVSGFVYNDLAQPKPDNSTLLFDVSFSEQVVGVAPADFQLQTTGDLVGAEIVSATPVGASPSATWQVSVASGVGTGTVGIESIPAAGLADPAGNLLAAPGWTSNAYNVVEMPPQVLSINRLLNDPTDADTLTYELKFGQSVTGVDITDFTLAVSGLQAAQIVSVVGSGDTYTVTVSHAGTEGTLGLNLVDDNSIVDGISRALGGTAAGDGDFTGETYTVSTATVTGLVFDDQNEDGIRQPGEPGLAGVTVYSDLNDNGSLDAGEPSTLTTVDDPGTTDVDELGQYMLTGLSQQTHDIRIILGGNQRQTSPLSPATSDGLTLFDSFRRPSLASGSGSQDILLSPDGRFAILGWDQGRRIATFGRNPQDGKLTFSSEVYNTNLYGLRRLALSPDGRFLYAPARYSDAINVLSVDTSGVVTHLQAITKVDDARLDDVESAEVSSDGTQLFVTSSRTHSLLVYDIDPVTGLLTISQGFTSGEAGVTDLLYPSQTRVSPDGTLVIVTTQGSGSPVALFDRDPDTGTLTQQPAPLVVGSNTDAVFTRDGKFLYIADYNGRIWTLTRDLQSGALQVDSSISLGSHRLDRLAMRHDESAIYALSSYNDSLLSFTRDPVSGTLTQSETWINNVALSGFDLPRGIAVSPDGDQLYVAVRNSDRLQTFWTGAAGRLPIAATTPTDIGATSTDVVFAVSAASPQLSELSTTSIGPVADLQVQYTVNFDEAVSGVDLTDFELTAGGLPIAAITSVTGGPTEYTVTVETANYEGNLQLQLIDDDTIIDGNGVPIGGSGIGSGAVVGRSAPLEIDTIAPQAITIGAAPVKAAPTSVEFYVTFSEAVSGVGSGDFATPDTGNISSSVSSVDTTSDPGVFRVSVSVSGTSGSVSLALVDDDSISDPAGNPLAGSGTSGNSDGSLDSDPVLISAPAVLGRIWNDLNGDGLADTDEPGLAGVLVYADVNGNEAHDEGEPSALTLDDDPLTTGFDETGTYRIEELTADTTLPIRLAAPSFRQTWPTRFEGGDGALTYNHTILDSALTSGTTYSPMDLRLSQHGKHLYVLSRYGNKIGFYKRDSVGDTFALDQTWSDTTPGLSGLGSPTDLVFTPDERFAYIVSGNTLFVTQVDAESGVLTGINQLTGAVGDNPSADSIASLTVSPDGQFLYTVGRSSDTASVYQIDQETGNLELVQRMRHFEDGIDWLDSPDAIEISPDGQTATIHSYFSQRLIFLDVIPGSGRMVNPQPQTNTRPIRGGILFSSESDYAYAGSAFGEIRIFKRDAATGSWNLQSEEVDGIASAYAMAWSKDQTVLYVADLSGDSIAALNRHPADGELTFLQSLTDVAPHDRLNGSSGVRVSPDGKQLFAIAEYDHAITVFDLAVTLEAPSTPEVTTDIQSISGIDFGLRKLFPSAVHLATAASSPLSDPTVDFVLTLDEAVSGVEASDFVVESNGSISGAAIESVLGGPTEFTIQVNTGTGDGQLRLRLVDDDTIVNGAAYPLGSAGVGNGNIDADWIDVIKTGSINGRIVIDVDADGFADANEMGIEGATILVDLNDNGVADPGEPMAISLPDDSGTPETDEAGTYSISGITPGSFPIIVTPPAGFALTNPASRPVPTANTIYLQRIRDGFLGATALDEAAGVTESPDGNYVYVASYNDDSVTVFSRDASTGYLTHVQNVVNNANGVSGLLGAQSITIPLDGKHLYVASAVNDALVMFERDVASGQLTYLGQLRDGIGGVNGLNEAVGVQITDDGLHLYVAGLSDNTVSVFTRDPATGLVSFTQSYFSNTTGAFATEISPDQQQVYVSATGSDAITVWDRDPLTGQLSIRQTVRNVDAGITGLDAVSGISLSPDGKHLYAAGYFSDKLVVFDRDLSTGDLTFVEALDAPNPTGSDRPISILVGPDGHDVVAMHEVYDAISLYRRDPATGKLTHRKTFRDGIGGVDGLNGAWDAEFSADGRYLHVVGAYDDAIVTFRRNAGEWIPAGAQAEVELAEETILDSFTVRNVAPEVVSIDYPGVLPITADTIDVTITFSEPVVGFDAADLSLGGNLSTASVTNFSGSGDQYVATVSLGAEQGSLSLSVIDDGSVDDPFGLDLGGPAIGDGTFDSATWNVDRLAPTVTTLGIVFDVDSTIRQVEFEVEFSEPVSGVDTSDFQIISSGLSDVSIIAVNGSGRRYSVLVSNTGGSGTLSLRLNDDDSIVDAVGLALGGSGSGNGDFDSETSTVEPAVISGVIFSDSDDDGYRDESESGLSGVTVYLDFNGNGLRDDGESFVTTTSDDGETPLIDEAGNYEITTDRTGPIRVRMDLSETALQQTSPRSYSGGSGFPTLVETVTTDPLTTTVFGDYGVSVSPDGNWIAVQVTESGGGVAIFSQRTDGGVDSKHWYPAGTFDNFGSPQSLTYSPDGRFLYLYSRQSRTLQTYSVDQSDGSLTPSHGLDLSATTSSTASLRLEISPDGKNLYSTSYSESKLRVFGVDPETGQVALLQTFNDWGTTPRLQNASGLAISPDGRHVYAGSFAEYYINAFDRSPIDGTLTKIQELPDISRPLRLDVSPDGRFIYVTAEDILHHNNQDLITLSRDLETGQIEILSRRLLPETPVASHLATDGQSFHYSDRDFENLYTLTVDPATGAFTTLNTLTDDVQVPGMRGIDDTVTSPDGKFLYVVNGYERNLHVFTRDQGSRSIDPHLKTIGFGAQSESFDFGIFNSVPDVNSVASNRPDPTTSSTAEITVSFSEPVNGFNLTDLSLTPATLSLFPSASIDSVSAGPVDFTIVLSGLTGTGQVELILDDDDSIVDSLQAPLRGRGQGPISLISFSVDSDPPTVIGWDPAQPDSTTEAAYSFIVSFSEAVQGVDSSSFSLATTGITAASITDVSGTGDTYTVTINTGSGDGTLTLNLVDTDLITDTIGLPLGGAGNGNGDASSPVVDVIKTGTLEGRVWQDSNGNGVRDAEEEGIAGVTVYLDLNDNGQLDAPAEPSVVTTADDPLTLQYDEAGEYQFESVDPGDYRIRIATAPWFLLASPEWDRATSSTLMENLGSANKSLRISPDGLSYYVFDHATDRLHLDDVPGARSGSATYSQVLIDEFPGTAPRNVDMAFTPDGRFMYMTDYASRKLNTYQRDLTSGFLTFTGDLYVPGTGAYSLEVSPDGNHLYVGGGFIAPYEISPTDGSLTPLASTGTPARVQDLTFNSDGTRLYAVDFGNSLIRVYSRDPANGSLTQIQALGSPTLDLYSIWSIEAAENDRDIYVAAPLRDMIWHFYTQFDGTLAYKGQYELTADPARDLPMDVTLSPDGSVLFAALGFNNAVQVFYRNEVNGTLTPGEILGTKDASITNIYENSSSLMDVALAGDRVIRVNNRTGEVEQYLAPTTDSIRASVLSDQVIRIGLPASATPPSVSSFIVSPTPPRNENELKFSLTFSENVSGVSTDDFRIASSEIAGATISQVSGSGASYTLTVDLSLAWGQGDLAVELVDDDSIANAIDVPLGGYGIQDVVATSPTVVVNLPAPTVVSFVHKTTANDLAEFTLSLSQDSTGIDPSDFMIASAGVTDLSLGSVTGGPTIYTVTIDLSAARGDGTVKLLLNDDDTIKNGRLIPLDGFGLNPDAAVSDEISIDTVGPSVDVVTANPSPLLDHSDLFFEFTFDEPVTGVDAADFTILQSGVSSASILSVAALPGNLTYQIRTDSGVGDGTLQLLLVDNDTIVDGSGNPLGGTGPINGDHPSEVVQVERFPKRDIEGHVYVDLIGGTIGVRDAGEPGAPGSFVYLDLNSNSQWDSNEPNQVARDDDPLTTEVDETGFYRFSSLALGPYTVRVRQDVLWRTTPDSSRDVSAEFQTPITTADLAVLENQTAIDGRVYDDLNQNAAPDPGDPGLAGWTIYVDENSNQQWDAGEPTRVTSADDPETPEDESGTYQFTPLELQTHHISLVLPSTHFATTPESVNVTLATLTDQQSADFGVTPNLTKISGAVFDDANADGIRSAGEGGLAGWEVFLDLNQNGTHEAGEPKMTTPADDQGTVGVDESGMFEFTTLQLSTYLVQATIPVEYLNTTDNPVSVSFAASTDMADVDFAVTTNDTTISGIAFDDIDRDGIQDAGEEGVAGATVYLDLNDNRVWDSGEPRFDTASDGQYQFEHVIPGNQVVRVDPPVGHEAPATSLRERVFLIHGNDLIREIDPATGLEIKETWLNRSGAAIRSLAFDGTWLWALDQGPPTQTYQVILKIHPDSHEVVDTHALLVDGTFTGLAAAGSQLFTVDTDTNRLYQLDNLQGGLNQIFDLPVLNAGSPHLTGPLMLSGAAGESPDGTSLLLETDSGRWLVVDPATGLITDHVDHVIEVSDGLSGSTGFFYVGDQADQQVRVYDAEGNLLRTLDVGCGPSGMASGFYMDNARRLTLELDEIASEVHLGMRRFGVDLSGVQYDDLNDNGVQDPDEPGLPGVSVFLDRNNNGFPDPGESQTHSGSDGGYHFTGVEPGQVTVRSLSPEHYRPSDTYPSRQRLFGISDLHSVIENCTVLVLNEFDPQTGAVLGEYLVNQVNTDAMSLTYDGQRLLLTNNAAHQLAELAYDGTIFDTHSLPRVLTGAPYSEFEDSSFVFVDGLLLAVTGDRADVLNLWQVELEPPNNGGLYASTAGYHHLGAIDVSAIPDPSSVYTKKNSTVASDGQSILIGSSQIAAPTQQWLQIDPIGNTAVLTTDVAPALTEQGLARLGDELFVAYDDATDPRDGEILVYDGSGNVLRTLNGFPSQRGLAGGLYRDNGVSLNLVERTEVNDVHHSHHLEDASISGNVSSDDDANGVVDPDEPGLPGVTVYADLDLDGVFDPGEPFDITDAQGLYTISGLVPGEYSVRQVVGSGNRGFAVGESATRLFTHATENGVSTIYEIDPENGDILNQFPAPGAADSYAGISLHEGELFVAKSNGLFRVDPDSGAVLGSAAVPPGVKDAIAIRDDIAYMVNLNGETIDQVDFVRDRVVARLNPAEILGNSPDRSLLNWTLGLSVDLEHFIIDMSAGTQSGRLKLDFRTGQIVPHTPTHSFPWAAYPAESNGEFFYHSTPSGWTSTRTTAVIPADEYILNPDESSYRQIVSSFTGSVRDYGAESALPHRQIRRVGLGGVVSDVSFGQQPATGSVSGVQFEDLNEDGVLDPGEPRLEGATVFIDLNGNDRPDPGEPQAISGGDGSYTLSSVPPGRQLVHSLPPDYFEPTVIAESTERLVGFWRPSDNNSPTGRSLQLREQDPQTGLILRQIDTMIPLDAGYSAAFDGTRMIVIDNNTDKLLEVGMDGVLLDEVDLPLIYGSLGYVRGPAVIDQTIYLLVSANGGRPHLVRYDATSNEFYGAIPVSYLTGQSVPTDPIPRLSPSVSASADGTAILAYSDIDSRIFVIDPTTAQMTAVVDLPASEGAVWSAASVGGELFLRGVATQSQTFVYDSSFNLLRTMGNPVVAGLGGGVTHEAGQSFVIEAGTATTDVNFGFKSTRATLAGTVTLDPNRNVFLDVGESGDAGVTVYLDDNRNGLFDGGEASTVTDENGHYVFENLPPRDYVVRLDNQGDVRALASTSEIALYGVNADGSRNAIRKYDAFDGSILREFDAPDPPAFVAGLAADQESIYYIAGSRLWSLDRLTGVQQQFVDLPPATYDGLAEIGGHLYVLNGDVDAIYKVNSSSMQLVSIFDINAINATHPSAPFSLSYNLGESPDGTRLLTRMSANDGGGSLIINPDTGVVEQVFGTLYGVGGTSAAGGETYNTNGTSIRVASESGELIRYLPVGFFSDGIAAAEVIADQYVVRAGPGELRQDLHFFQQTDGPASIRGKVWDDRNGDGVIDPDESGIAGRTVYLDANENGSLDEGEYSTVTTDDDPLTADQDETGDYHFEDVVPGSSTVAHVPPIGWEATYPFSGEIPIEHLIENGYVAGQNNGTNPYYDTSVSADGRFVAFTTGRALLPEDTFNGFDVYLHDRDTDQLELISVNDDEQVGNGRSLHPVISADGSKIVFWSYSTNFVANDNNDTQDIFVRDRTSGVTRLVSAPDPSLNPTGSTGNSYSYSPGFSDNGRYVTFWSNATDLVPGDTNALFDLFERDLQTDTTTRLNLGPSGVQAEGGQTHNSHVTSNGNFVSYWSWATNLVPGDTNGTSDAFVWERATGLTERVSVNQFGFQSEENVHNTSLSDDGRYVAFHSSSTTLDPTPGSVGAQVFLKDRQTGRIQMISKPADGSAPNGASVVPLMSGDGRWIVFHSFANNLVPDDTNASADVFVYNIPREQLFLVSRGVDGNPALGRSDWAKISNDGTTITFNSDASNLTDTPRTGGHLHVAQLGSFVGGETSATLFVGDGEIITDADFGNRYAAPTDLTLSSTAINENADTSAGDVPVGDISVVDEHYPDGHLFELIAGVGDGDNGRFLIVGDELKLRQHEILDHESDPQLSVRIRATNSRGFQFEKTVQIDVGDLLEVQEVQFPHSQQQRSIVDSLSVHFDDQVTIDAGAFRVLKRDGSDVDVAFVLDHTGGKTTATLQFSGQYAEPGGSLADGHYQLLVDGSKVRSIGDGGMMDGGQSGETGGIYSLGDSEADQFYRLFGDRDGDRDVDADDLAAFAAAFRKTIGHEAYDAALDSDGDGDVDVVDYGAIRKRLSRSMPF